MKIKVIVTGATGMVGEGVMHECRNHPDVNEVLIVNRKPSGFVHAKLREIIHEDFFDLTAIEDQLSGYDACYFCLGTSSVGMSETDYRRVTYDLTMNFARTLVARNPRMVFCYVSGAGTDSSEQGRSMWARVKGKTENDLMRLPFQKVYSFRPAFIQPTPGLKNTLTFYKYLGWLVPLLKKFVPRYVSSLRDVGTAMINVTLRLPEKAILEVPDIIAQVK